MAFVEDLRGDYFGDALANTGENVVVFGFNNNDDW